MSRKHYKACAAALNAQWRNAKTPEVREAVMRLTEDIAAILLADNPRFDWGRFLDAVLDESEKQHG